VDRNKILRIHGFGNAIVDDLMDWQSTCERKFKFNPNTIELENAKKDIKNKLVLRKKNIENDLLNGVNSLKKAREETILGRESLIKELEVIFKQLAQAEGHIFIGKNIKLKVLTFLAMVGVILALITIQ
jgi:DNA-binding helix-hairpin-helix protein with protein kinase domain